MRISSFLALATLALLAGCNSSPPPAAPQGPQIPTSVTGTVMLREPRELSNAARVDLRVIDVAQPATPLAQTSIPNASRPPIQFTLPIDPKQVDPKRIYAVDAVLTDGERRYLPALQSPVLTDPKHTSNVQIIVAPEPTPAEKMFDEYKKAYAQIGTMKQISGSSMGETSSTAWDAFLSNGKVKVVREITDLDNDKGRITMKMAYQNDKPWVVVREESANGSSHPYATSRIGWDENGQLVLKDRLANGQLSDVSAEEAKNAYAHAQQAFNTAQANAPKK
ncbi:MAG TPA: YbaY family lipoprotein [Rudaea sp.]|nr:YbaY family lipoprotein [Rudaea sp.]